MTQTQAGEGTGQLFAGRYLVERTLGVGAVGRVVLARDTQLDRPVALKLLTGDGVLSSVDRFVAEAEVLARLRHPHILEVYDAAVAGGRPFLVLEYAAGGSLRDRIEAATLSATEALELAGGVLEALLHAHAQGVLHRDVKPENVLLTAEGVPKLADFGLAKHRAARVRTRSGLMVGTPPFMAPEIFTGSPASPATDLYAWGCLLHALLHGAPPFTGSVADIVAGATAGVLPGGTVQGPAGLLLEGVLQSDPRRRSGPVEIRRFLARTCAAPEGAPVPAATRAVAVPASPAMATRASLDPPGGGRRPAGWRGRVAAAAVLGVLGLAVAAWWSRGAPVVAPAPAVPPAERARASLRTWRERARQLDAAAAVTRLHAITYAQRPADEAEIFQAEMAAARAREPVPADLVGLDRAREALPWQSELDQEREDLRSLLEAGEVPFSLRRDLAEALQEFVDVDDYFRAWGLAPVYRVEALVGALYPITVERLPEDRSAESIEDAGRRKWADPGEAIHPLDREPGPGVHLVYHFGLDRRREAGVLVQHPERLSSAQSVAVNMFTMTTLARTDPRVYAEAAVDVPFGEHPEARLRRVAVRVLVGNLLPPDALRIEVNGALIHWRSLGSRPTRPTYKMYGAPEYRVEVEVPVAALRPGRNRIRVTLVELPGLLHYHGADVFSLHLVLEG